MPAKVGINLVDLPEDAFHLWMHGCHYPALIVFAPIVTNSAYKVGR